MGFDCREFKRFRDNFEKLSTGYEKWLQSFLMREATRFLALVKPLTPVDTGDLRDHWIIGKMFRQGDTLSVEILNPMEYAEHVEYGHRTRGGAGMGYVPGVYMMDISLKAIYAEMPAQFNAEFEKFLKGLGVT